MDIEYLDKKKDKVVFLLKGSSPAFANMARRTMIDNVPTMAIEEVEIRKNSKTVHVHEPNKTTVSLEWRDPDFRMDETCYYYVRILQIDNEEAISSPIWVN